MQGDSNVCSFMRFVKLHNLQTHLYHCAEQEKDSKDESSDVKIGFDTSEKEIPEDEIHIYVLRWRKKKEGASTERIMNGSS